MLKRFKMATGAVLGVAALALGGSAIAAATSGSQQPAKAPVKAASETTTGPDTDNVQSGDQTTPDSPAAGKASESKTSENAPESGTSESSTPNDGPGGHADPPGNVDNQQQGQN